MKNILVFVNFTEASASAVKQASALAKLHGGRLCICHVGDEAGEAGQKLRDYSAQAEETGVEVSILTGEGDFFKQAPLLTKAVAPDLVIVGALGADGFSIRHFGSAIYKLVRSLPAATLILQGNSPIHLRGFSNVMLPLSAHKNFKWVVESLPEVVAENCLVNILGVTGNGAGIDETLSLNAEAAKAELDRLGIKWNYSEVVIQKLSSGYAEVILAHMEKEGMDLIAMPADVAKRSQHFGKMDKEALLSNGQGYPVLCVNTDTDRP